jgi:hypothetical protein
MDARCLIFLLAILACGEAAVLAQPAQRPPSPPGGGRAGPKPPPLPTNPIIQRPGGVPQAAMPPRPIPVDMPGPADLETAEAEIKARFSAGYAGAKTAQDKSELAEQLVRFASADQPPAARAAALQAALRLAVEAQDVPAGVDAAEKMHQFFKLDTAAALVIVEAYEALLKTAKPADSASLGRAILTFARKAKYQDENTVAEKAASLLGAAAKKSRDPELVKAAKEMAQRVEDKVGQAK